MFAKQFLVLLRGQSIASLKILVSTILQVTLSILVITSFAQNTSAASCAYFTFITQLVTMIAARRKLICLFSGSASGAQLLSWSDFACYVFVHIQGSTLFTKAAKTITCPTLAMKLIHRFYCLTNRALFFFDSRLYPWQASFQSFGFSCPILFLSQFFHACCSSLTVASFTQALMFVLRGCRIVVVCEWLRFLASPTGFVLYDLVSHGIRLLCSLVLWRDLDGIAVLSKSPLLYQRSVVV